jgi:hypothetical protein
MKKIILFIVILLFSCKKNQEKSISSIEINYVSIGSKYGQLCKPPFNITEKIIKNNELAIMIYEDTLSYKRVDTLKLYKKGKIIFNNVEVKIIDSKSITKNDKVINIKKIYIPHVGEMSVDNFSGEIIYFTNDGILARYGTASNYISLYRPNIYSDIHNKILFRKLNFKRHPEELIELP